MTERAAALVTILFTDLLNSTELLSRAGDEEAQRVFRAHHDLLNSVASAHGGEEVKWLGDGLMVVFESASDAVRAAISMQQATRRPIAGEHLAIRVGLNAGEALRDTADYFGTAVVVARRLCDRAEGGQILCAHTVRGLLAGRAEFDFAEVGDLELKGVPKPVASCEVRYSAEEDDLVVPDAPLIGREVELARLQAALAETMNNQGRVVLVAGEPGIGKTTLVEELADHARHQGAVVVWGRCFESDWSPPYGPFAEALAALVTGCEPDELRADLGAGAGPLAQLVAELRSVIPDLADPPALQPDEERFRLLEAVAQLFLARARRSPVVLCLDDLQWADRGTVAMLRHVARSVTRSPVLIVGTYRDMDVDRSHPLVESIGAIRREAEISDIKLDGLSAPATAALLAALGRHEVPENVGAAWARETDGNPLFVRELLRHFIDEGHLVRDADGVWRLDRPLREMGIPPGVRDVIARRLSRLSPPAQRFLGVACAFEGPFSFEVVAAVAELDEFDALDAVDEALSAQLLAPADAAADTYVFVSTPARHTVYGDLSPSRRVRLHRKVAEALERLAGDSHGVAQGAEIAAQYHHSRTLPGAERGVEPALHAVEAAEAAAAYDTAARLLRMTLDLLPPDDPRRARLLGRLGTALAWGLAFDEAAAVAAEAGEAIAATEGTEAAAHYLSDIAYACAMAGGQTQAWALASRGLAYAGSERDVAWARLVAFDHQRREAGDPDHPGIPIDTPERGEAARIIREARLDPLGLAPMEAVFYSRDDALLSANLVLPVYWAGEYTGTLARLEAETKRAVARGQLNRAARCLSFQAFCYVALGRLDDARQALDETAALTARVGQPAFTPIQAQELLSVATDEGLDELAGVISGLASANIPALAWTLGWMYAILARIGARQGQTAVALRYLNLCVPWLERAPMWTVSLPIAVSHAAEALWVTERLENIDVVEYAVREKVIEPDFRCPMVDGRLTLARLCALQGRHEEAQKWLGEARRVLDEQGALPLLAIADYDEALMFVRRGAGHDAERARPLLATARRQFVELGMTGWVRRAEELAQRLG